MAVISKWHVIGTLFWATVFTHLCCPFALHHYPRQSRRPPYCLGPSSFSWRLDLPRAGLLISWCLCHPMLPCPLHPAWPTSRLQHSLMNVTRKASWQDFIYTSSSWVSLFCWTSSSSRHLPHFPTYLLNHDYATTRPLHLPVRTSSTLISIPTPHSCSKFPHYVFTCTTVVSSSIQHFFLPHCCRPRIWPWWRCCEHQLFFRRATQNVLSFLPLLASSMSPSLIALLLPLLSAFGVLAQVTITRTAPSTSAPIAISPLPDTLRLLVCPPNATYVANGDIATDSVPLELVSYVIEEAMSLTIVRLMFFPLSRLSISLGIPLVRDRCLPHGVLIEPGGLIVRRG